MSSKVANSFIKTSSRASKLTDFAVLTGVRPKSLIMHSKRRIIPRGSFSFVK